jgi:hypothetical protein
VIVVAVTLLLAGALSLGLQANAWFAMNRRNKENSEIEVIELKTWKRLK